MPTSRPRIAVTETDELARTLELAADRWPEDRGHRGRLLAHVIDAGAQTLAAKQDRLARDRRRMLNQIAGSLTDCFPEGYLTDLREDWPA